MIRHRSRLPGKTEIFLWILYQPAWVLTLRACQGLDIPILSWAATICGVGGIGWGRRWRSLGRIGRRWTFA